MKTNGHDHGRRPGESEEAYGRRRDETTKAKREERLAAVDAAAEHPLEKFARVWA